MCCDGKVIWLVPQLLGEGETSAMISALAAEDYWQTLLPAGTCASPLSISGSYVATLPDGWQLPLPIRPRDDGTGLASLIVNQASFSVLKTLAAQLVASLSPYKPAVVVGLPTLSLTLAAAVAEALGHSRYVPLGTSRKFWYRDELSVPISSVTTATERRLYIDPRLLPLLATGNVVLIDDVISTGRSMIAGLDLLNACSCRPVAIGAAMLQSDRWRNAECPADPDWQRRVHGVFSTPVLRKTADDGWEL